MLFSLSCKQKTSIQDKVKTSIVDTMPNQTKKNVLKDTNEIKKYFKIYDANLFLLQDVNFDGIKDAMTIVIDTILNEDNIVTSVAIFEGNKNQTFNQPKFFYSDDDNQTFSVNKKGVIAISYQAMRNDVTLKIRYDAKYNNYMVIGKDILYYQSGDCDYNKYSMNYLTGKAIHEESCWDVTIQNQKVNTDTINFKPTLYSFEDIPNFDDFLYETPFYN